MIILKWVTLLFFISSCTNENNITTVKSLDTDSVIAKLKKLKDSALTRIEITPLIYFVDTINEGQSIEGKFKIINKGNVPLVLKKIVNVCDCTVTESSKLETEPDDSSFLNFKISTDNFKPGFNVRVITIMGNFHPLYRVLNVETYVRRKE